MFELMVTLSLKANGVEEMPFVWFWPSGYSGCIIMTHDVETAAGRDFCLKLREMDAAFGMKSSFQIVPEDSYEVPRSFLDELRASGCEVNLHGLNHSGYLFTNRTTFLREVAGINRYAKEYGARGFRAPVMYRNLDWYGDFDISYDMSVPNTAHLDPQRGGCCTVMPYFIGRVVELPLTTLQDYTLFHILGERRIDTWKRQVERILDKHGLVSFNVHPDYVKQEPFTGLYKQLLEYLAHICAERKVWIAAPGEVDSWWRQRSVTQPAGSALTALARTDGKHVDYQRRTFRIGVNA
jgi:hypothetical protein